MKYSFCPSLRFVTCASTLRGYGIAVFRFAVALMLMCGMARAQSPSPLLTVPLGYCQLAGISVATSPSACSGGIPAGATAMVFQVTTTSARYRDDGVAPTASLGMPIGTGISLLYSGTLSKFSIIPTAATSTIDILFYRFTAP